jgi:signal transduction histidine kinase
MHVAPTPQSGAFPLEIPHLGADDVRRLLDAVLDLSHQHDLAGVAAVVRRAARDLTGADGVTFVLRDGPLVHYADENAIGPLWKGRRFPIECCVSGWAILHREPVAIEDVYADPRVPLDAYRSTFVKSLAMVPIRQAQPVGAIGAYWATRHRATPQELELLVALAGTTAVAIENAALVARLGEAVRARDAFIAAASHELRTPLAPLQLKAEHAARLLDRGEPPERARRALGDLDLHVKRISRLVDTMLEVSREQEEPLAVDSAPVDLTALAGEVAARFAREGRPDAGTIEVAADGPVLASCDRERIEQVIAELVANGLRWGEGRGVQITASTEGAWARVDVRDHGRGIAPEDQERVFERYERGVPARHYGGLGVGLWLARRFVEAHGGRLEVESRRGAGSCFTVRLPR